MRPLTLLLAVALCACGPSTDPAVIVPEAEAALESGDPSGARAEFDRALALIGEDPQHPMYLRATLGAVEAMAFAEPEACVERLFELALAEQTTERTFAQIGGRLASAAHYQAAAAVLSAGQQLYPESEPLAKLLERVGKEAARAADDDPEASAALDVLRGLGYLGGPD